MAEPSPAPDCRRYVLRGDPPYPFAVPQEPMRAAAIPGGTALWLGPDEWLLLTDSELAGGMLVDVSHRSLGFLLHGADAAERLNGAVPLDLDISAFPVGRCTRTLFGKAEIVLWRRAADFWHIEVARSFVPYFRDLLAAIDG